MFLRLLEVGYECEGIEPVVRPEELLMCIFCATFGDRLYECMIFLMYVM